MSKAAWIAGTLAVAVMALGAALPGCGVRPNRSPAAAPTELPPSEAHFSGCVALRVTPQDGAGNIFVNSFVSVAYQSALARECTTVTLRDALGREVPLQPVHSAEWRSPISGFFGVMTLAPAADLHAHARYGIDLQGVQVASFTVGPAAARRGTYVTATNQPAGYGDLPAAARIPAGEIDTAARALLLGLAGGGHVGAAAFNALAGGEVPSLARLQARHGARIKKLRYTSTLADGTPIVLSGLLVYPEHADGGAFDYAQARLVLAQRGSRPSLGRAPSGARTYDVLLGLIVASRGHVYFEPDLIGMGDTRALPQARLAAQDTASATHDMLLAVRDFFERAPRADVHALPAAAGTVLGRDLVIAGASQGAYSSFAALPYLARDANVVGIYGLAGPYNVFQTFSSSLLAMSGAPRDAYALQEDLKLVPGQLRSMLATFRAHGGLQYDPVAIFRRDGRLSDAFLRGYRNGAYPEFVAHLGLNSIVGSTVSYRAPDAKVVLFHHEGDSLVPARNTADMLAFLQNGTHRLASVRGGSCHENAAFIKALVKTSSSQTAAHTVCALYWLEQVVADL